MAHHSIVGIIGNLCAKSTYAGHKVIRFNDPFNIAAKSLLNYFDTSVAADDIILPNRMVTSYEKLSTNLSWGVSFSMTYGEFDALLIAALVDKIRKNPANYIIGDITKIGQYYAIKRNFPNSLIIDIGATNTEYIPYDIHIGDEKLKNFVKKLKLFER